MDVKLVFSGKELERETGRNSEPPEMVVNGFCLKEINPLFVKTIEGILERLPSDFQEVFPSNIRKKLEEMGLEKYYNIEANLKIHTTTYWKSKNGVETDDGTFEELKEIVQTKWTNCRVPVDVNNENAGSLWIINQKNVESYSLLEILQQWAGDNNKRMNIDLDKRKKAKFLVIHNLDKKLKEMEKYVRIDVVFINVSIIKEGVGDMMCSFCILLSTTGKIKEIIGYTDGAEEGKWELFIMKKEGEEDETEGFLSFEEAERKLREKAVEGKITEGFNFLFA